MLRLCGGEELGEGYLGGGKKRRSPDARTPEALSVETPKMRGVQMVERPDFTLQGCKQVPPPPLVIAPRDRGGSLRLVLCENCAGSLSPAESLRTPEPRTVPINRSAGL